LLKGFRGTLIHVFNKNENALHKSDYFEKLVHRDSIILMGDSLGDLRMAHGAAKCHNILTFGFLNDKVVILFYWLLMGTICGYFDDSFLFVD